METSFGLLLWRASLEVAPVVPGMYDLVDWAALLRDANEGLAASLLLDVVAIRQGFSPRALGGPGECPVTGGWTVRKAVAELEDLATAFSPTLREPPRPTVPGHPSNAAGIGPAVASGRIPVDIGDSAARLRAFLADPAPSDKVAMQAEALLAELVEADRCLPAFDYRALRDGPLDRLVTGIALAGLIDFALGSRDLVSAPTGSIAFLHRAARLDREGLGPYLSGVPRIVRESRDLFEMATQVSRGDGDARDAWIVLLSRECLGPLLHEIVDDLGDRGLSHMLGAILDRTSSRQAASVDRDMVARIRDAALDNADWVLAARAQARFARLSADAPAELALLGAIHATGGDFSAAESAFHRALELAPTDLALRAKLQAVLRNDASELIVSRGLASPATRQALRLRRRGVTPLHRPREGERVMAVDVS